MQTKNIVNKGIEGETEMTKPTKNSEEIAVNTPMIPTNVENKEPNLASPEAILPVDKQSVFPDWVDKMGSVLPDNMADTGATRCNIKTRGPRSNRPRYTKHTRPI